MKKPFIEDSNGRDYSIDEFQGKDLWSFKVVTAGYPTIAYANCTPQSNRELHLADINVEESLRAFPHKWPFSLFLPRAKKSFRGLGIGTALLRRVLQVAKQDRFQIVTGRIFPKDLTARPWLPNWYAQFGFSTQPDGDGILLRCPVRQIDR